MVLRLHGRQWSRHLAADALPRSLQAAPADQSCLRLHDVGLRRRRIDRVCLPDRQGWPQALVHLRLPPWHAAAAGAGVAWGRCPDACAGAGDDCVCDRPDHRFFTLPVFGGTLPDAVAGAWHRVRQWLAETGLVGRSVRDRCRGHGLRHRNRIRRFRRRTCRRCTGHGFVCDRDRRTAA